MTDSPESPKPSSSVYHEPQHESKDPQKEPLPTTILGHTTEPDLTSTNLNRIYHSLDGRIIPPFWLLYFLCSAVRSNPGLAQTMNLSSSHDISSVINLTPHELSTGLALFYVAYVIFELPSNLAMSRLSPSLWLARIVISVGVIGIAMVGMKNVAGYYVLRFLLGAVEAGMWPGMSLYLTLFYPTHRMAKRVGWYFTASQVSAAVVGLVSAGFQKMDGLGGLEGFRWMFLLWGLVTFVVGVGLLWWLPDRPAVPGEEEEVRRDGWRRLVPRRKPALEGEDARAHYEELSMAYARTKWTLRDLWAAVVDWRFWPLLIMYFGVVGVGNGVQSYGTVILRAINPGFSGVELSLLYAPIWICDLIGILCITPISDRFHRQRALWFTIPTLLQIIGLLIATYATSARWAQYFGLLLVGFGLGPTVPITMTWTAEIFQPRHGEIGVAAAGALVSGLGNLGSVVTNYALFAGWPEDMARTPVYLGSNWVMIGILMVSILASWTMEGLLRVVDGKGRGMKRKVSS
ncbi:high-affinity nicotinic acid plasma membrane permease like protein [Zymoseptoria brevis]|uniref:High-affinity nicotinic acid plasma membrane permease like protein n=1 Tax=Zymoseptoria brevis TaxID=1047168 RepID=A0A0F4GCB6_9PEZI|nr:high-affinity nicotinic acid plasma membrane permease like protein [Zymoseptoria brevis]